MLGFLLWAIGWITTVYVVWEVTDSIYGFHYPSPGLLKTHGFVLLGVLGAVAGWISSLIIATRNSIKQHTINTLLNSRLSTEYMKNAREINARYFNASFEIYRLTTAERESRDPDAKLAELGYILNYLEFISAAVRAGDLNEQLMRQTLRAMLCSFYELSEEYILAARKNNRLSFENLHWLYNRWFDPKLKLPQATRPPPPAPPATGEPHLRPHGMAGVGSRKKLHQTYTDGRSVVNWHELM